MADDFFDPGDTTDNARGLIKNGRYSLPDPITGEPRTWTRASTMSKAISDTFALNRWHTRMTAKGLSMRDDLMTLIASTDDKEELDNICRQAQEAAGSKAGANMGTAVPILK